jgi:hypothetical protein
MDSGASIASTPRPSLSSDLRGAVAPASSPAAWDDEGWPLTGHDRRAAGWCAPPVAVSTGRRCTRARATSARVTIAAPSHLPRVRPALRVAGDDRVGAFRFRLVARGGGS